MSNKCKQEWHIWGCLLVNNYRWRNPKMYIFSEMIWDARARCAKVVNGWPGARYFSLGHIQGKRVAHKNQWNYSHLVSWQLVSNGSFAVLPLLETLETWQISWTQLLVACLWFEAFEKEEFVTSYCILGSFVSFTPPAFCISSLVFWTWFWFWFWFEFSLPCFQKLQLKDLKQYCGDNKASLFVIFQLSNHTKFYSQRVCRCILTDLSCKTHKTLDYNF